jgi:hypothetical protein
MDANVFDYIQLYFNDSDNLFQSLTNETKKHSNGFWGTNILMDKTPFYFERSQLKKGKKLNQTPKNKADKTFHLQNENGEIMAMFSYTKGWDEPCYYDFIKKNNSRIEIFTFDIEKRLISVQQNSFYNNLIGESVFMRKNGNYIAETYYYDNSNRIVKIERQHKDMQQFEDTSFFPDNIYNLTFVLKYDNGEMQPFMILSGTNPQKRT